MSNINNFADFGGSDEDWMSDYDPRDVYEFDPLEYEASDDEVRNDWYDDVQEYPE